MLVSGKGRRYFGRYNAKGKTCANKLLAGRRRVEEAILFDLSEKILTIENLEYVYKNVEKAVAENLNEIPEQLKSKRLQYEKTLSSNMTASGQALKELLGSVTVEPIMDREMDPYQELGGAEKKFKPYYVAHTRVDTLSTEISPPYVTSIEPRFRSHIRTPRVSSD